MKNRISAALRGAIDAVKKKPFVLVCVLAAIAAVAAAVFAFRGGKETEWNKNALAAGLPEITACAAEYSASGNAFAAYYSGVSLARAEEYARELEAATGKSFSGESYPRVLDDGNRIITLHMNVSENRLSVTVIGDKTQENSSK